MKRAQERSTIFDFQVLINLDCSRFLVRSSLVGMKKFWIDLDRNLEFGFGISRPRYYLITYNLYVSRKYKYVC